MFTVKPPEEVFSIISSEFHRLPEAERCPLARCCGRILAENITACENVPGFNRSTVDGYAVRAADTFGCSDSIPAILPVCGEVKMGKSPDFRLDFGTCAAIPTGGELPEGADAVVMVEYTEDYGDGSIGILKPASPGLNLILRGDDVFPGKVVLTAGRRLTPADIGALAAMGISEVPVCRSPIAGILSTGDELVPVDQVPEGGQVRDINSSLLEALCRECGAEPRLYGIIPDDILLLKAALEKALLECDLILISGGSSVGAKDATARVLEEYGQILFHGVAMKPGKPTMLGSVSGKPVFGLPGHPVAAFFVTQLFVREAVSVLTGRRREEHGISARLTEAVSTNHGRCEVCGIRLSERDGMLQASPVHTKSGLISVLAGSDGYIIIPRDCEGLPAGREVFVHLYSVD